MGNVHGFDRPSRLLSGMAVVSLSTLFIAVYGLTGWVTSLRADVGTCRRSADDDCASDSVPSMTVRSRPPGRQQKRKPC